jgi:cytidylate kinase
LLAKRLGAPHLDTGAMYRAVALDAMQRKILGNPDAIAKRVRTMKLEFDWSKSPAPILLDGKDVSEAIRAPAVTDVTYEAADNPWVREELVRHQRAIGKASPTLVTEGRDQGTIVFPDAAFKFYLDAHPEERARRRIAQLTAKGITAELHDVLHHIVQRDMRDQARAVGALARPKNGIVIDTTDLSLEQVVEEMLRIIKGGRGAVTGHTNEVVAKSTKPKKKEAK